jgi:acid phosphatase
MNTTSLFGLSVLAALLGLAPTAIAQDQPIQGTSFQQWGFLIFENVDYSDAKANPTFQKIHNYRKNRLLSQYYAVEHPSLPNYLASIAGTTFGVQDDDSPDIHSFPDSTILDLLETKGVSWKMYAEEYSGACLDGVANPTSDLFAVKHVPALYFQKITADSKHCQNVVDASQFQADLDHGTLPQWWYYIPNLNDDGHDTSVAYMASYLNKQWVPRFENETFTRDLAMVVTFDESETDNAPNHVYAALIGDALVPTAGGHEDTTRYDHYSLIRTVEENWGLGSLGKNDSGAAVIITRAQNTNNSTNTTNSSNSASGISDESASAGTRFSIQHKSGSYVRTLGSWVLFVMICKNAIC